MKYNALAPVYDKVMRHVNYDDWVKLIKKINSTYFLDTIPRIFEIGGGTGTLAKKLIKSGYSYSGSDYSYSMCREARKKNLGFFCCDCRYLPVKSKFDFVIFLYDGINYLQSLKDYSMLFEQVSNCLDKDGLFLFDITTETNSLRYFSDYVDYEDFGDCFYLRHSYYNQSDSKQYNDFTIFKKADYNNSEYNRYEEHHVQKVFSPRLIKKAINLSDFSILGIWDDFSFNGYSLESERIHFLLQKI